MFMYQFVPEKKSENSTLNSLVIWKGRIKEKKKEVNSFSPEVAQPFI